MSKTVSESLNRATRLPQLLAATTIGIALLALVGWQANVRFLAGQWDSYVPMAPATALAFLLLGGALFVYVRAPNQRSSRIFALTAVSIVSLLGVLVLAQFITGIDLGVERALSGTSELLGNIPIGRMSPLTAVSFLLESAAILILLSAPRWRHVATTAALLAASAIAINFIMLVGYVFGAPLLYSAGTVPMSFPSAAAFVAVGIGLLPMTFRRSPTLRPWSRLALRGRLLNAFVLPLAGLVLFEGWLETRIDLVQPSDHALWHALGVIAITVLIVVIVGWVAHRVGETEEHAQAQIVSLARFPDENPNPVLRVARDGSLLYANRSSQRLLEYWQCEQAGQSLPEAERRLIAETFERGISQHEEVTCGEITYWLVLTPILEMDYVNVYGRDITERKRAEEALRETTQLLETILDSTHMLTAYMDPQFNFVRVNRAYAEADERESSFFPGKNHFALYPNAENEAIFRHVVETGQTYFAAAKPFEYAEHPERGVSYWDWSLVPVKNPEGAVTGLVLTLVNVTERKRAEEEIRRMALMLDTAPNSITVHDFDGRFLYANQRTLDLHGFTRDEFLALNLHQLDVPDSENLIAPRMQELLDHGEATFESAHYRKDDSTLPLEISARVTTWGDKKVILSIATDITERKRAEEALHQSEKRFRALVEQATDLVAVIDREGTCRYASPSFERMLGYAPEELIGKDLFLLVHPDDLPDARRAVAIRAENAGLASNSMQVRLRHSDGSWRVHEGIGNNLLDDPAVQGIVITSRDVTERKQAEEALRKKDEHHRNVVESIFRFVPEGLLVFTENLSLVNQNKAFEEITQQYAARLGYTEQELAELITEQVRSRLLSGDAARTEIHIPKKRC